MKVSSFFERSQYQKFVTDFGVRFFLEEINAKARAKAQNQFGGDWAQGPNAAPQICFFALALALAPTPCKKSYTKCSDKFCALTGFDKQNDMSLSSLTTSCLLCWSIWTLTVTSIHRSKHSPTTDLIPLT